MGLWKDAQPMDETTRADRLNQNWDALLADEPRQLDPAFERTLLLLHNLHEAPTPSTAFADRLWDEISASQPIEPPRRLRQTPLLAVAASLAILLIVTAVIGVLRNDDDQPQDRIAIATEPVSPTDVPATETTVPAVGETPDIAIVPTDERANTLTATTAPPDITPTIDPNSTVPTGPTPPVQAGGGPAYETLEHWVNASNLVVLGRMTGDIVTTDEGRTLRAVSVERTLRGDLPGTVYVSNYGDELAGDAFVLFLSRLTFGPDTSYAYVGMLPVVGGVIAAPADGLGLPVQLQYVGQTVDALQADIATIPNIEPLTEQLLSDYGWTPIVKQSLWPRRLPETKEFDQGRVLPFMPHSFAAILDASNRIGLDFSALAGQDVQILVYLVEREPDEPMERAIRVGFVVHEQSIAGAWITVDATEQPYGLDERETVLDIPAFIPTPEPTPTIAVPTGETINPAEFYRLAETTTFNLCWPYCDQEPKTVGLRNAIIAALDQELTVQPLDIQPTPTRSYDLAPSDGSFVQIVFGHLTPGWQAYLFGYDREAQLLLLPYDGGWVPAPAALVDIMERIEPPPPPTKPV